MIPDTRLRDGGALNGRACNLQSTWRMTIAAPGNKCQSTPLPPSLRLVFEGLNGLSITVNERMTEWKPLTEAREINATNEVHRGQTLAGANPSGLHAIVGEIRVVHGRPRRLARAVNCPVPTAKGDRTYVSIFFR